MITGRTINLQAVVEQRREKSAKAQLHKLLKVVGKQHSSILAERRLFCGL